MISSNRVLHRALCLDCRSHVITTDDRQEFLQGLIRAGWIIDAEELAKTGSSFFGEFQGICPACARSMLEQLKAQHCDECAV